MLREPDADLDLGDQQGDLRFPPGYKPRQYLIAAVDPAPQLTLFGTALPYQTVRKIRSSVPWRVMVRRF